MAARHNSEDPLCFKGTQQYTFFDHSNHSITTLFSNPETHLSEFNPIEFKAFNALERSRAERTNSIVLETLSGGHSSELSDKLDEDYDLKSDAESSCCLQGKIVDDPWEDDEQSVDELVFEEGTRKRLKLLAGMVGVESNEPGVVLAEVVSVLKDLKRLHGYQQLK